MDVAVQLTVRLEELDQMAVHVEVQVLETDEKTCA